MKMSLIACVLGVCLTAGARPLLVLESSNGVRNPAVGKRSLCEIYWDKIVITHAAGLADSQSTFPIRLGAQVPELMRQAAAGKVTAAPVQAFSSAESSTYQVRGDDDEMVVLLKTGGSGSQNRSPAAASLIQLLDMNCR